MSLLALAASAQDIVPANPHALPASKKVLSYLASLAQRRDARMLSGQNVGHGGGCVEGYQQFVEALAKLENGKHVALLSLDYGWDRLEPQGIRAANAVAIAHWKAGGLVTISTHVGNPFVKNGQVRDKTGTDLKALLTAGSEPNRVWMAQLEIMAEGLAELQRAGVVVLWRPFHEMNGGWFWWCHDQNDGKAWTRKEDFTRMWRHMFEYFTKQKGLGNLLWVYSANHQRDERIRPTDEYYPGGDVVDVVGYDLYNDDPGPQVWDAHGSYTRLAALGKPFGLTEFGPLKRDGKFDNLRFIEALKKHCPNTTFFVYWHSWKETFSRKHVAIVDNQNPVGLVNDPWVITRDEIPGEAR